MVPWEVTFRGVPSGDLCCLPNKYSGDRDSYAGLSGLPPSRSRSNINFSSIGERSPGGLSLLASTYSALLGSGRRGGVFGGVIKFGSMFASDVPVDIVCQSGGLVLEPLMMLLRADVTQ